MLYYIPFYISRIFFSCLFARRYDPCSVMVQTPMLMPSHNLFCKSILLADAVIVRLNDITMVGATQMAQLADAA